MSVQLNCPNCHHLIHSDDINIDKTLAKCRKCHHVFDFSEHLGPPARHRAPVLLPPGFEAFHTLSALNIEIKWRHTTKGMGFFIFFTLLWNGILSIFILTALISGAYEILIFTGLHLLVGVGLLYYVIAVFINKTYVWVSRREINIEHRPLRLPFYPNRTISASDLEQLFIRKYVSSRTNGRPNYAFSVEARLKNGQDVSLVKRLGNADQAAYLEQQIEKFLNIDDKPIMEEWRP